ncbi:MAG: M13 family metallopeptidase [Candidatus Saccharibacteria bacterium]|nr:M13 family metallopeptidase [Candidatus Saccharibacteria bacterium]
MTKDASQSKLDSTIRPQDDFYGHVNNIWTKNNPIPDSESRWGIFNVLREDSWSKVRDIYEGLQNSEAKDVTTQQAKDFYYTGINFDNFSTKHMDIAQEYLSKVAAITDTASLSLLLGQLHRIGLDSPWQIYIDTDDTDSSKYILRLYQSGLSLPDRDYYLSDSTDMKKTRQKYEHLLVQARGIFEELAPSNEKFVKTIIDFETAMAKKQRTNSELRDVEGNYNPITFNNLKKQYSNIDWDGFAQGLGWTNTDNITVDQPEFITFINEQFVDSNLDQWKMYLQWHLVRKFLPLISSQTSELHFQFYGKAITGAKENMPLWKRVVLRGEYLMGENIGKIYAQRHFPEASKKQVVSMVDDVSKTFARRIGELDWMSDKTKQYAVKKLNNMKVLVGYPDVWRDFSNMTVTRDSYLGNVLAMEQYNTDYSLAKLGQANSREEWHMSPQTVNAYHDPNRLVICFPAAILQPPFFDPAASHAHNFSGIGAVIGHELTHGFDDQGCQFDADGNVRQWQTAAERKRFSKKAQIIKDQANGFEVLPGITLNGELVIGEAIADLGGIELALDALRQKMGEKITDQDVQDFFINFARTEVGQDREQKAREFALTDPHPPGEFRVNAMLQHVDSFYDAFSLIPYDQLFRLERERAKIW